MCEDVCPVCGAPADPAARACGSCGAGPGEPASRSLSRRGRRAVVRLPDADRHRALRLQVIVAVVSALLVLALGWLALVWWPAFVGDHVVWDRTALPRHSPDGRWDLRGVDYGGFGLDSAYTTWLQVRERGETAWRTIYVGDGAETVRWRGHYLRIDRGDVAESAMVDVRGEALRTKQFDGGLQVYFLTALAAVAVALGFLVALLPRLVAWRRARAVVRRDLAAMAASRWEAAAALLGGDAGAEDLAADLEGCVAARLLPERRARLSRTRRIGWEPVRGWRVGVRFCDPVWPLQMVSEAYVRTTSDRWLLVPGVGMLASGDQTPPETERPRGPGGATLAAIVLGVVGGLVGLAPIFGAFGLLLVLTGLVVAVVTFVRVRGSGASQWPIVVALCVCALALPPGLIVNGACFWVLSMPPTTYLH